MRRYFSIVIILAFAFFSCNTDQKHASGDAIFGNLSSQITDTLRQIGPPVQVKEIDPAKDLTLIGDGGTRLFISANSLLNEDGKPAAGKVKLELKEHYGFADFIAGHLQTVSGSGLLQTQGMIYFNAKDAKGATLRIDGNKPVRIEFPVAETVAAARIFKGQRDENGNMNWDTVGDPGKLLIPFPIRTLATRGYGECGKDFGFTTDRKLYEKGSGKLYLTLDSLSRYENTLLATREFRDRYYSYCMPELTKIYIDNLDKNLWEIDEMMVQYFIRDSAERVSAMINDKPPRVDGQPVTKDQLEAHQSLIDQDKEYGHTMIEVFKKFAAQKLTRIDPSKKIDASVIRDMTTAYVSYDALQFGWVNVDYFYEDPKAKKLRLIAKPDREAIIVDLILPGKKIVLSGIGNGDNAFRFTKDEKGYNKLPEGERAIIVCIGISGKRLYFGDKEIIIGQRETEDLAMKEMSGKAIGARLKTYGR